MKTSNNEERKLGPTEDMYWRFDSVSPLNFGTIATLQGELNIEDLRTALDAVQARHPLLRVCIKTDKKGIPWFRQSNSPIRLNFIKQEHGTQWEILEEQLSTAFNTQNGPLIRCTFIRHSKTEVSLITVFHHAISDGRSATFIMRDLLQSLTQINNNISSELPTLPLLEYYGERIPTIKNYKDIEELSNTAWKTLQASANFFKHIGLPMGIKKTNNDIPLEEQSLLIEPRFVEASVMKKIAAKAKKEEVTVQCVLNAALALAVVEDSPTRAIEATSCTQVLDIRERLVPPVGEDCGCFASGATSMHHLDVNSDFWPLTRDIKKSLQESLDTPLPFFHPAIHKAYSALGRTLGEAGSKTFSNIISKLHPEGLAVSNLGRVQFTTENSAVEVTDFAFATNTNILNYFNTSVTTYNGRMTWSFSASSALGRKRVASVADKTITRLLKSLEE